MKTCNVLASLLFGSLAAAAPLGQRDLVTKTEVVVETVVVYTTIWDAEPPVAEATTTPGLFYEQPSAVPTLEAEPTQPRPAPPAKKPSSSSKAPEPVYTPPPPPPPPSSTPEPTSVYTPPPPPPPAPSSPAPEPSSPPLEPPKTPVKAPESKFSGDITIYDNTGAAGACGNSLHDSDMIVALAQGAWGESTYDVMTGESTNPWCGKTITIEYEGNAIQAEIQDLCPGCAGEHDIDLSLSAWKALTGLDEKTRLKADWWVSS